jgi:hypothetical protein
MRCILGFAVVASFLAAGQLSADCNTEGGYFCVQVFLCNPASGAGTQADGADVEMIRGNGRTTFGVAAEDGTISFLLANPLPDEVITVRASDGGEWFEKSAVVVVDEQQSQGGLTLSSGNDPWEFSKDGGSGPCANSVGSRTITLNILVEHGED